MVLCMLWAGRMVQIVRVFFALTDAYTYHPAGDIHQVTPSSGSWTGGYEVVVRGTNLCNGQTSDVVSVRLCGTTAAIESVSATQIVLTARSDSRGIGDVVIHSTEYGVTIQSNAFEYLKRIPLVSMVTAKLTSVVTTRRPATGTS